MTRKSTGTIADYVDHYHSVTHDNVISQVNSGFLFKRMMDNGALEWACENDKTPVFSSSYVGDIAEDAWGRKMIRHHRNHNGMRR